MTCRHHPGNPDCSSSPEGLARAEYERAEYERKERKSKTPDSKNYLVVDAQDVGTALVLKVRYPNCTKCEFEGDKIIVFLKTKILEMVYWREIDPHFRPKRAKTGKEISAPGPDARFPATAEGWADAINYAKSKQ